ncbi:hypothetical protein BJ546DRAFT_952427 [Cryomyces antarcticus]
MRQSTRPQLCGVITCTAKEVNTKLTPVSSSDPLRLVFSDSIAQFLGYVPEIYGCIEQLHPSDFAPHLDAFSSDSYLPNAILIEYLPDAQQMNCSTYTKKRMATAVEGIKKIHEALVEHSDPYPKNILVVPGNLETGRSERVVWIDFDVAITYEDASCVREEQKGWMDEETECVEGFGQMLVWQGHVDVFSISGFYPSKAVLPARNERPEKVNYYMRQHATRYGFVLTDTELLAIKRLPEDGVLEVAEPVAWTSRGPGRLTVLLSLWYLGRRLPEFDPDNLYD